MLLSDLNNLIELLTITANDKVVDILEHTGKITKPDIIKAARLILRECSDMMSADELTVLRKLVG